MLVALFAADYIQCFRGSAGASDFPMKCPFKDLSPPLGSVHIIYTALNPERPKRLIEKTEFTAFPNAGELFPV